MTVKYSQWSKSTSIILIIIKLRFSGISKMLRNKENLSISSSENKDGLSKIEFPRSIYMHLNLCSLFDVQ